MMKTKVLSGIDRIDILDTLLKGERVGFAESKKQMAWYIHGVTGAAEARGRLMTATSPDEAEDILRRLVR